MKKFVFSVETDEKCGFYDITDEVKKIARDSGVKEGICVVYVPHTTAGVNINENCDPNVTLDLKNAFTDNIPDIKYYHDEGNSSGHFNTALVGNSENIIIEDGELQLGTWQAIFFAEFDGPRSRQCYVKIING